MLLDTPRHVEASARLAAGRAVFVGDPAHLLIRDLDDPVVFAFGNPPIAEILAALPATGRAEVIVDDTLSPALDAALAGWTRSRIVVHSLGDAAALPDDDGSVRLIDPAIVASLELDEELLDELLDAAAVTPIAAAHVGGVPVAFCYAGAESDRWWDVAIDTVPAHQRRGHAGRVAAWMIRRMEARGKAPVWQAVEENPASMRLAEKLGFVAVGSLLMYERADDR